MIRSYLFYNKPFVFVVDHFVTLGQVDNPESLTVNVSEQDLSKKQKLQEVHGIFYRIISNERKEVGNLMGTVHMANEKILRLNSAMQQALIKADSLYLEIEFRERMPLLISKILEESRIRLPILFWIDKSKESEREKLKNFVELLFPELINKLVEEGASSGTINALSDEFKKASLESKLNLEYTLITHLNVHRGNIIHLYTSYTPVGIEDLLLEYMKVMGKKVYGLEEDTDNRRALAKKVSELNFFSIDTIDKLPSNKNEIEAFITKQTNEIKSICEAWIDGNEDFFKNWTEEFKENSLYAKVITERDSVMANKIHDVLSRKEEENTFFAIGSAHLVGNGENVIRQLEKKGWKLERVF